MRKVKVKRYVRNAIKGFNIEDVVRVYDDYLDTKSAQEDYSSQGSHTLIVRNNEGNWLLLAK